MSEHDKESTAPKTPEVMIMDKLDELLRMLKQIHGGYPLVFKGPPPNLDEDPFEGNEVTIEPCTTMPPFDKVEWPGSIPLEEID